MDMGSASREFPINLSTFEALKFYNFILTFMDRENIPNRQKRPTSPIIKKGPRSRSASRVKLDPAAYKKSYGDFYAGFGVLARYVDRGLLKATDPAFLDEDATHQIKAAFWMLRRGSQEASASFHPGSEQDRLLRATEAFADEGYKVAARMDAVLQSRSGILSDSDLARIITIIDFLRRGSVMFFEGGVKDAAVPYGIQLEGDIDIGITIRNLVNSRSAKTYNQLLSYKRQQQQQRAAPQVNGSSRIETSQSMMESALGVPEGVQESTVFSEIVPPEESQVLVNEPRPALVPQVEQIEVGQGDRQDVEQNPGRVAPVMNNFVNVDANRGRRDDDEQRPAGQPPGQPNELPELPDPYQLAFQVLSSNHGHVVALTLIRQLVIDGRLTQEGAGAVYGLVTDHIQHARAHYVRGWGNYTYEDWLAYVNTIPIGQRVYRNTYEATSRERYFEGDQLRPAERMVEERAAAPQMNEAWQAVFNQRGRADPDDALRVVRPGAPQAANQGNVVPQAANQGNVVLQAGNQGNGARRRANNQGNAVPQAGNQGNAPRFGNQENARRIPVVVDRIRNEGHDLRPAQIFDPQARAFPRNVQEGGEYHIVRVHRDRYEPNEWQRFLDFLRDEDIPIDDQGQRAFEFDQDELNQMQFRRLVDYVGRADEVNRRRGLGGGIQGFMNVAGGNRLFELQHEFETEDARTSLVHLIGLYGDNLARRVVASFLPAVVPVWDNITWNQFVNLIYDNNVTAPAVANAFRRIRHLIDQGVMDDRVYLRDGRAYRANQALYLGDVYPEYYGLETGLGEYPANPNVPPQIASVAAQNTQKGLLPSIPLSKPVNQFERLVKSANELLDTKLYKNREVVLNHKVDIISDALNSLKNSYKDAYYGKTGILRVQMLLSNATRGTFVKIDPIPGRMFLPTSVRMSFGRGWKSGAGFGVYYLWQEENQTYALPVMQFSRQYKKSYGFTAAPYFGYADSIFQFLKIPSLTQYVAAKADVPEDFFVPDQDRILRQNVRVVRGTTDIISDSRFTSNVVGTRQFEQLIDRLSDRAGVAASLNVLAQLVFEIGWLRFVCVRTRDFRDLNSLVCRFIRGQAVNQQELEQFLDQVDSYTVQQAFDADRVMLNYVYAPAGVARGNFTGWAHIEDGLRADDRLEDLRNRKRGILGIPQPGAGDRQPARIVLTNTMEFEAVPHVIAQHGPADTFPWFVKNSSNFRSSVLSLLHDYIGARRSQLSELQMFLSLSMSILEQQQGPRPPIYQAFQIVSRLISHIYTFPRVASEVSGWVIGLAALIGPGGGLVETRWGLNDNEIWNGFQFDAVRHQMSTTMVRPIRMVTNIGGGVASYVTESQSAKAVLASKVNEVVNAALVNEHQHYFREGQPQGYFAVLVPDDAYDQIPVRRPPPGVEVPENENDENVDPNRIGTLNATLTLDGYAGDVGPYLKYLQTLAWIRNFNYGSKLERQKISKNRVTSYITQDTKQLKKLIYTFGGQPTNYLQDK
jgi:hypothetical protein